MWRLYLQSRHEFLGILLNVGLWREKHLGVMMDDLWIGGREFWKGENREGGGKKSVYHNCIDIYKEIRQNVQYTDDCGRDFSRQYEVDKSS